MPMDFPAFPAVGQEYTVGTVTYVYNGTGWVVKGSSSDQFVVKSGDTMTGHLGLPNGPSASQAVRKDYVDTQDNLKVNKSGDTMTGNLVIDKSKPDITLNRTDALEANIRGMKGGLNRWVVVPGNNYAETGANVGSDFWIARFDDAGDYMGLPFTINRKTGDVAISAVGGASPSTNPTTGALTVAGGVGINGDLNVNGNINFKGVPAAPFDALAYNGMQINGSMDVSQERGLASPTPTGHILDGWRLSYGGTMGVTAQQANLGAPGLTNMLQVLVTTAQVSMGVNDKVQVYTYIEGYRTARLAWGFASAQPITIGFWTAHKRPGVYSVTVKPIGSTRSYNTTYTHAAADTLQYNTVTIPGDTTGTWNSTNLVGMYVMFAVATGVNLTAPAANVWGANFDAAPGQINGVAATSDTFRITGVVVLPGTQAPTAAQSPLIMRPYDQELLMCQRYYEKSYDEGTAVGTVTSVGAHQYYIQANSGSYNPIGIIEYKVPKRAIPTNVFYNPVDGSTTNPVRDMDGSTNKPIGVDLAGIKRVWVNINNSTIAVIPTRLRVHWTADARL